MRLDFLSPRHTSSVTCHLESLQISAVKCRTGRLEIELIEVADLTIKLLGNAVPNLAG